MDDVLTWEVLEYQQGRASLERVRNRVLVEAFEHLRRYSRKGEDEVSEFLLEFHGRIEGLLRRFEARGLPFRHYLLRSLRWQWNSFRTDWSRRRRQAWLAADTGWGSVEELAESGAAAEDPPSLTLLSPVARRRLVLLALKAAPYLDDGHLEAVCRETGAELAWLQACQQRLRVTTRHRSHRREILIEKRGEAYCRRLMAEDDARREADPDRRRVHERRAGLYRTRLANLTLQQNALSTAPTHQELARLLNMPKGSVDSGLYHLKKHLRLVYSDRHDDPPSGDQQHPQKT